MRGDNYYGYGARSQKRKRKKTDRFLNISIGVVIFLILFVGGQLLLGGSFFNKSEKVNVLPEENQDEQEKREEQIFNDTEEEQDIAEESETELESVEEYTETESEIVYGDWRPVGTVQEEPFTAVYEKEHINWAEMEKAFRYATGLSEDEMITWRIGNGGDHKSAIGIVSDSANASTPFRVRIEWVTNEGWMPVEVEVVDENPYL